MTPPLIIQYVSAFARYCILHYQSKTIVVGRDGRLNGDIVAHLVIATLRSAGIDVVDIGIVPTPTVQIATEDLKTCGGISISASHNPQERNGLKFLNPDGTFPVQNQVDEIVSFLGETNQ